MKVISFEPILMPTAIGGVSVLVFGLGDDGLMYAWDGKKQDWVLAK